jgi:hypothetical protein
VNDPHESSSLRTIKSMSRLELVDYVGGADANSNIGRTGRLLLNERYFQEALNSIENLTTSQSRLSSRLWWLNLAIALATVVVGIQAAIGIYDWTKKSEDSSISMSSDEDSRLKSLVKELGGLTLDERIELSELRRWERQEKNK